MELSRSDLAMAVLDNDADYVEQILRELRLPEKIHPTVEDQEIIATILGFTANLARHDKLSAELAEVVIKHTTIAIDVIKFIELVVGGDLDLGQGLLKTAVDAYISDSAAIPRYVYENKIISGELMFAYMGLCLLRTDKQNRAESLKEAIESMGL